MGTGQATSPTPAPPPPAEAGGTAATAPETDADVAVSTDAHELRPSSRMTREIEALDAAALAASSMCTGSVPSIALVPQAPPTEPELSDVLPRTLEAPAIPRSLILDAAEALIADVCFAAVSEEELARAAGVTIDVFHVHFADKTALLRALNDRFCAAAIVATDDATLTGIWDRATPHDVIEVAVRSILDVVVARSALVRAVISSADPELLDGFRRVGANMTARVARAIDEMRGENKPDKHDVAFALLLAGSLAHQVVMLGAEWSGVAFEHDDVCERAARAVRAYLDARPQPS